MAARLLAECQRRDGIIALPDGKAGKAVGQEIVADTHPARARNEP